METTRMILRTHLGAMVQEKTVLSRRRRKFKNGTRGKMVEGERLAILGRLDQHRHLLKADIRHQHLALGVFIGTPYRAMEPRVREGNEPKANLIHACLQPFLSWKEKREWTANRIEAWLEGKAEAKAA